MVSEAISRLSSKTSRAERSYLRYGRFHGADSSLQLPQYPFDVTPLEQAHDSQVVTFVHPHVEGLVRAAENSSASRPKLVVATGRLPRIAALEQNMIIDQLLLLRSRHVSMSIDSTRQIPGESRYTLTHHVKHSLPRLRCPVGIHHKRGSEVPGYPDTRGNNHPLRKRRHVLRHIICIQIGPMGMLQVPHKALVIFLNAWLEEVDEGVVRLGITSVQAPDIERSPYNVTVSKLSQFNKRVVISLTCMLGETVSQC